MSSKLIINLKNHTTMKNRKMVAGNWKMNMNLQEGIALATELKNNVKNPACAVVIGTPFIHLASVAQILKDSPIQLAAENCANHEKGAYTGEVSAAMVRSTGAQYCILGHSERRAYYHETPELLKEKVNLALANDLKVIFCIGEVKEEREAGKQNEVVKNQLEGSVFHLTAEQWQNIVLAYEPVWAIGTGLTATPDQAEDMHRYIRSLVATKYGQQAADDTTILYGGSCNEKNAAELFANEDVDGGLIGGASLVADKFLAIIAARNN
ncbi:MAG: triose-phosphate isomerase [Paludibacteraceae bacterium]|nr:triose-phosphate isomerase [Paludibacteraceae bacterium]